MKSIQTLATLVFLFLIVVAAFKVFAGSGIGDPVAYQVAEVAFESAEPGTLGASKLDSYINVISRIVELALGVGSVVFAVLIWFVTKASRRIASLIMDLTDKSGDSSTMPFKPGLIPVGTVDRYAHMLAKVAAVMAEDLAEQQIAAERELKQAEADQDRQYSTKKELAERLAAEAKPPVETEVEPPAIAAAAELLLDGGQ